ncbi:MAG TPA: chemotaxis protein CheD [Terracidiphilus sp.]|jgi:chemotaxis protein CheD
MTEPDNAILEIYVQPGESRLVSEPAVLRTVLGSCVGITFLIPRLGVAALCHPMLPKYPAAQLANGDVRSGRRYVDFAVRDMACRLDALGAGRGEAVVKLFGGNDVLAVTSNARPTVGKLNSEAAIRVLADEGFAVTASCLGGEAGIHITFDTSTGEVRLRHLDDQVRGKTRRPSGTVRRSDSSSGES